MAHRKNVGVGGNTKTPTRVRSWTFTLNNYSEDDIKVLQNLKNCDYVFQEETGEQGTEHLQGVLTFKNARTFSSLKKITDDLSHSPHWEICMDLKASRLYCSKEETRTGKIFTNIELPRRDLPARAGTRTRVADIVNRERNLMVNCMLDPDHVCDNCRETKEALKGLYLGVCCGSGF